MKYFIDTHDKNKGSFPAQELTEEQFFDQFAALEEAAKDLGVFGHAALVNLKEGKAFCFMSGPDEESIRKAHAAINLPYDSITEVRRVTGADIRIPQLVKAQMRKGGGATCAQAGSVACRRSRLPIGLMLGAPGTKRRAANRGGGHLRCLCP